MLSDTVSFIVYEVIRLKFNRKFKERDSGGKKGSIRKLSVTVEWVCNVPYEFTTEVPYQIVFNSKYSSNILAGVKIETNKHICYKIYCYSVFDYF